MDGESSGRGPQRIVDGLQRLDADTISRAPGSTSGVLPAGPLGARSAADHAATRLRGTPRWLVRPAGADRRIPLRLHVDFPRGGRGGKASGLGWTAVSPGGRAAAAVGSRRGPGAHAVSPALPAREPRAGLHAVVGRSLRVFRASDL